MRKSLSRTSRWLLLLSLCLGGVSLFAAGSLGDPIPVASPVSTASSSAAPTSAAPASPTSSSSASGPAGSSAAPSSSTGSSSTSPADPSALAAGDPPPPPGETVLAVQINGKPMGDFVRMYRHVSGRWYVTADFLAEARLKKSTAPALRMDGTDFYPLDDYSGVTYRFDSAQQLLYITIPAENFQTLNIQASKRLQAEAMASSPGLFLNHNLQVSGTNTQVQVSGEEEFGFFSKLGVLTSQFVAKDLTSHWAATRLHTQFFRDFPHRMATLGFGDAYSATFANWAQSVNYAGIRWASNFTTQPAFLPFALPSIAGSATQPSTVDLYVNSLQTLQQPVDTGPFTISDIPVVSPEGNLQLVVTDMLGRQQVVSMPYISTRQLLRKRVSEYTYESGVERRNFGQESNGYGTWFAAGTYRRGFTNTFTLGLRGEALLDSQTGGIGFDKGFLYLGVVSAGIAASRDKAGHGAGLAYAQVQHISRNFGFSFYGQAVQPNFRQLGLLATQQPTQYLGQGQFNYMLGRWITVGGGALHEEKPGTPVNNAQGNPVQRFNTVTPSLGIRLPHGANLTFSGNYTPEFHQRASGIFMLTIPLKGRQMVLATTDYQQGVTDPAVEYDKFLPAGRGWGYRLRTSSTNNLELPRVDAGVTYQNDLGTYELDASQQRSSATTWLFNYMGATSLLHGDALFSRQLTDSFAVVDANGAAGVKVLANNNYVAKTDWRGLAIVPWLPAYNLNKLSLDESSVPPDMDMDLTEKTVVPMARSGLLVKFKAQRVQGAMLALVTEAGKEVPLGAEVTVNGGRDVYEVALHGEVYIPEIQFPAAVSVRWDGGACQATVDQPASKEPMPKIGPITCRRMK